jgi:putative Ca2+/H+ antiporter (TMEM165/GDT1 family)
MDPKLFAVVFGTIFLAELGDKTQLATLLYASDVDNPRWTVFVASSLALVVTSAIGVLAGTAIAQFVNPKLLSSLAGVAFIAVGAFMLFRG